MYFEKLGKTIVSSALKMSYRHLTLLKYYARAYSVCVRVCGGEGGEGEYV